MDRILHLPPTPGIFYLENPYIQLIHAICLNDAGRDGPGEHVNLCHFRHKEARPFHSDVEWPEGFIAICRGKSLPKLNDLTDNEREILGYILKTSFLNVVPLEPQEIGYATGKFRYVEDMRLGFSEEDAFVVLFDQTYGGLKLTSKLLEREILEEVLHMALHTSGHENHDGCFHIFEREGEKEFPNVPDMKIHEVLHAMAEALSHTSVPEEIQTFGEVQAPTDELITRIRVLCPGEIGMVKGIEPFEVMDVFWHPQHGLAYRGKYLGTSQVVVVPADQLHISSGQKTGLYHPDTGEVVCPDETS